MMMSPRVQVSCALLKLYGTTASTVRVGYDWRRKCVSTAHWGDVLYLRCVNCAGEFTLQNYEMDRVKTPGTDSEISARCLGVAEISVRQTETDVSRLKRTLNNY